MRYSVRYRSYARPFRRPLTTARGVWSVREGAIVELQARSREPDAAIGQGEIAPLPWFGSETQTEALEFCRSLAGEIDDAAIDTIPDRLPACQFAFESARAALQPATDSAPARSLEVCHLLPAGSASLAALDRAPDRQTFKWKIATASSELDIFQTLLERLPTRAKLRLDANGGLSYDEACCWLEACDRANRQHKRNASVEFLEQPLPPAQRSDLQQLGNRFATPIALDESIASLEQLRSALCDGWQGVYVIKPAIIGSPQQLRSLCSQHQPDTVFSSVFETAIGRDAGLQLARELQTRDRAIGYGLDSWLSN